VKEAPKTEEVVAPKEEFLTNLLMMGFNIDISTQALIKVKNESVAAAIEAVIEIQNQKDKDKPKEPEVKVKQ
jgi:uncharacterized UBP type Zn finger protein